MKKTKRSIRWRDAGGVERDFEAVPGQSRGRYEEVGPCNMVYGYRRLRRCIVAPDADFETIEFRASDLEKLNDRLRTAYQRVKDLSKQVQALQRFKNSVEGAIAEVNAVEV